MMSDKIKQDVKPREPNFGVQDSLSLDTSHGPDGPEEPARVDREVILGMLKTAGAVILMVGCIIVGITLVFIWGPK